MSSGTLTYHTGYNYGASLQAYALQTIIKRECGPNQIINFETLDFVHSREMLTKHPKRLKEVVKILTRIPYASALRKRQQLFDAFTDEQLDTTELCRTREEAIEVAKRFDCLVCGSDQIWNLGAPGDEYAANTLFFLDFPKGQRRVSYAASFGGWVKHAAEREDEFLPWVREFDAVSVREISGYEYLQSKGVDCCVNVDPTLLLDADDYRAIERKPANVPKKYVLLFGWSTNRDVISVTKKAGKFFGVPAINIVPPPRAIGSGIKRVLDIGPREFLYLVDHAEFVVTNSFHGTVFSSIFGKQYASIHGGTPDTRMKSVLDFLGLSDRLVTADGIDDSYFMGLSESDFDGMSSKLAELRKASIDYIRKNVR